MTDTNTSDATNANEMWRPTDQEGVIAGYSGDRLIGLLILGEPTGTRLRAIRVRDLSVGEGLPPMSLLWDRPPSREEVERDKYMVWSSERLADLSASPEVLKRITGENPDEFYRRIAQAYSSLAKVTRKPTATIAKRAGVKPSTAAAWVYQCRRLGLLPATTQGKATR